MPPANAVESVDLLSLVLRLRPLAAVAIPPRLGRAAEAILLAHLAGRDADLASSLHDNQGLKPFTCSNLLGPRQGQGMLDPSRDYTLRYTALEGKLAGLLPGCFSIGQRLAFEGATLEVEAFAAAQDNPWSATCSYSALLKRHMLPSGIAPAGVWTLLLASPTAFQSQGRTMTLPEPRLVFGSLVERWNTFAPLTLPADEVRAYADEMVAVNRFELQSAVGWVRGPALRVGAIGHVTYRALNHDRYWRSVLSLLADYALYSGIGALTTAGMGQARLLPSARTARITGREYDDGNDLD